MRYYFIVSTERFHLTKECTQCPPPNKFLVFQSFQKEVWKDCVIPKLSASSSISSSHMSSSSPESCVFQPPGVNTRFPEGWRDRRRLNNKRGTAAQKNSKTVQKRRGKTTLLTKSCLTCAKKEEKNNNSL